MVDLAVLTQHQLALAGLPAFMHNLGDVSGGIAAVQVWTASGARATFIGTGAALDALRAQMVGLPPVDVQAEDLDDFRLRRSGWPDEWSLENPPTDDLMLAVMTSILGDEEQALAQLRRHVAWELEHLVDDGDNPGAATEGN